MNKLPTYKMLLMLIILLSVILSTTSCSDIRSTKSLLAAIESKYYGKWYTNIRFSLAIIDLSQPNTEKRNSYVEEYVHPAQLLIKSDIGNNDGYLYKSDTIYVFNSGEIIGKQKNVNEFAFFNMDLYNYNENDNLKQFQDFPDFDYTKFCRVTISGKKYYVVGISDYKEKSSEVRNQIWFDAETLLLSKIIKVKNNDVYIAMYENFIQVGGTGWIPQKVTYYKNDKVNSIERYYDFVIPVYEKKELRIEDFCDNESLNERQFNSNVEFSLNYILEP